MPSAFILLLCVVVFYFSREAQGKASLGKSYLSITFRMVRKESFSTTTRRMSPAVPSNSRWLVALERSAPERLYREIFPSASIESLFSVVDILTSGAEISLQLVGAGASSRALICLKLSE